MAINITYFVHWTTTDNEQNISSGWSDVELSELWIKQSLELIEQTKDKNFDLVFCSDLKRAVKSSEITFGWKCEIIQDNRLRECNYWDYNWFSSDIVEPMQEVNIENSFPNGEGYEDVKLRITDFLEYLKQNFDWKNIAIVWHKAPQLALDVILKWQTWEEAFASDWRKRKDWQPGWEYIMN